MTHTAPHMRRFAALLAAAALALSGCSLDALTAPPAPPTTEAPAIALTSPDAAAPLAQLATIPSKGRASKTGYEREQFGPAWKDTDRNGCDTRNDILRRDLSAVEVKPGTRDCVILSGTLADAYTGTVVDFVRGSGPGVDIDHLVPLSDAWQKGAQSWDQETRERFANDPTNLAATSARANRQKGDSDLATWLPPNRAHWCAYAAEIVAVKASYGLWMTPAEHGKASEILKECTK
jgi:hypothetical protein